MRTLPVGVRGSASVNSSCRGHLYGASSALANSVSPRAVAARLLANHTARPTGALSRPRGGMAPARLRRVFDRVETELLGPLTLPPGHRAAVQWRWQVLA